jgi:hypothetical protein
MTAKHAFYQLTYSNKVTINREITTFTTHRPNYDSCYKNISVGFAKTYTNISA